MSEATAWPPFRGWPSAAFSFYEQLEADNTRDFWLAHKDIYDGNVRAPFAALADLAADEFGALKVFRPNRDTRFSTDKSPYKTRCYGIGEGPHHESNYVEISADGLTIGSGYWMMARDQLARYRAAVDDEGTGSELTSIVAALRAAKLDLEGHALKTAPRGFPRDHPRVELLRLSSVAAVRRFGRPRWVSTAGAAERIFTAWRAAAPLNAWLGTHVGPSTEPASSRWN